MKLSRCRFCNQVLTTIFADLGTSPLANSFLDEDLINNKEHFFPLKVFVCDSCLLVQLEEFETPENIFSNYAYFSSYSESWLKHAEDYINMMITEFKFDNSKLVVEIASNDGYLLQYFKRKNIPVLGIEPAANIAKVALEKGIPTLVKFFSVDTAKDLANSKKQADLIIGNNVLAHVPDLNDFVKGMKILLKPEGIITMEFPHLLQLIKETEFDTIYHEHFSYFSLLVVQKIFSSHGLLVFDVQELSTHGGSLRIFAKHKENNTISLNERVDKIIKKEKEFGLDEISTYTRFQEKITILKQDLYNFVVSAKNSNKKLVGYGAAAKGNTLLNYCGIGTNFLEYVVDRSKHKQGLYLPGTHIPIRDPEKIRETKPDYVLILPWNLKDEIMSQMSYIRNWGGKFVVPIPEVKIYS
ncbi:MAG TPA: class I SAM-dependent methyltransferase [Candidatus Nitrosotalea sp.]|nr:class I SAM-dependent methyltransferase [Candidatus Nitrosotalea sp.]